MPWKVGNKISELVVAKPEISEITLVYKNKETGEKIEYTTKTLPYKDTALMSKLEFVEQRKNIIKHYEEAPIKDFFITDTLNDDYTNEIILNPNFQFIFVTSNINKANIKNLLSIIPFYDSCYANNIDFIAVSGSAPDDVYKIVKENNINYEFYFADETALKSVVRSNPGMVLLYNGVVVDKWHYNDFPQWKDFLKNKDKYIAISKKADKKKD